MKLLFKKETRSFSHSENLSKNIKKLPAAFLSPTTISRVFLKHPQATALQESRAHKKATISTSLFLFFFFSSFLKFQSLKTTLARSFLLSKIKSIISETPLKAW